MTNEELYLKERVGQKNPFRTPEGYVAALVVTAFSFHFHEVSNSQQQAAVSESYIDEAADYAMLDNMDIYQLLAEE